MCLPGNLETGNEATTVSILRRFVSVTVKAILPTVVCTLAGMQAKGNGPGCGTEPKFASRAVFRALGRSLPLLTYSTAISGCSVPVLPEQKCHRFRGQAGAQAGPATNEVLLMKPTYA